MTRLDWLGVAFIAFMVAMHGLALHDADTVADAISLQAGVLSLQHAGK